MAALQGLGKYLGLLAVIYVLIFLHFVNTDHLKYYQIKSFSDKEACELEREKSRVLIMHSSQEVVCLEIIRD